MVDTIDKKHSILGTLGFNLENCSMAEIMVVIVVVVVVTTKMKAMNRFTVVVVVE